MLVNEASVADRQLYAGLYTKLLQIRLFEQKAAELFRAGRLPGFLHSSLGQEAVPVGVCSCLRPDDYIISTHRGHGDIIAKGARLDRMMAELFAKRTGYCRAKGGSMHIADFGIGVLGAMGIVGSGLPIATGAGLSAMMRNTDQVVAAFFGDGAANQGTFHEAVNLASIWNLPVVFVCQNNLYAMSTPRSYHMRVERVSDRAVAYGIPGRTADGNDVLAVREAALQAIDRARRGEGPSLLECITYRHSGHFVGDPGAYRPKGEVEQWMDRDPVRLFRSRMLAEGLAAEDELRSIEAAVERELEEALQFAESSPEPELQEAQRDLFAGDWEV